MLKSESCHSLDVFATSVSCAFVAILVTTAGILVADATNAAAREAPPPSRRARDMEDVPTFLLPLDTGFWSDLGAAGSSAPAPGWLDEDVLRARIFANTDFFSKLGAGLLQSPVDAVDPTLPDEIRLSASEILRAAPPPPSPRRRNAPPRVDPVDAADSRRPSEIRRAPLSLRLLNTSNCGLAGMTVVSGTGSVTVSVFSFCAGNRWSSTFVVFLTVFFCVSCFSLRRRRSFAF